MNSIPVTVELKDDDLNFVAHALQTGEFESPEAVILEAIRLMREGTGKKQTSSRPPARQQKQEDDPMDDYNYGEDGQEEPEMTIEDVFKEARSKGFIGVKKL
jgi:Arc/MetJ-type ribon-helix-helix transcriptional regulator